VESDSYFIRTICRVCDPRRDPYLVILSRLTIHPEDHNCR
jgi:hypothetical protein